MNSSPFSYAPKVSLAAIIRIFSPTSAPRRTSRYFGLSSSTFRYLTPSITISLFVIDQSPLIDLFNAAHHGNPFVRAIHFVAILLPAVVMYDFVFKRYPDFLTDIYARFAVVAHVSA